MASRLSRFFRVWWSVVIAIVGGAGWVAEVFLGDIDGNRVVSVVFAVITAAIFAFSSRYPLIVPFLVIAVFVVHGLVAPESLYQGNAPGVIVLANLAVIGALPRVRERLIGLSSYVAGTIALILGVPVKELGDGISRGEAFAANLILIAIFWTVSWIIADRVRAARVLRERAARLEAERDEFAEASVADERARIARELHDVVAHSVSVMTVQAGGVRRLLHADQEREREALEAIESTGRTALTEMRRMVGVMRAGNGVDDARAPQPGLQDVDRLAEEIRDAGLPVEVRVLGERPSVSAGVDLSAYRIVQEGLTNVLKHAGPARATVTIRYEPTQVDLVVVDDGVGNRANGAAGHGLIGMRERVAVYGGTLEHGARDGGGFRVHATLPLDGPDGTGASA